MFNSNIKKLIFRSLVLCFILASTSCKTSRISPSHMAVDQLPSSAPLHSLYLIGDAGKLDDNLSGTNKVLEVAKLHLQSDDSPTTLVYLGDNIYPEGLHNEGHQDRALEEKILDAQLALAESHGGSTYFIPGNHDWNRDSPGGLDAVRRQEKYIESKGDQIDQKVRTYPSNGCGDPKVIKIHKDLAFVFIDSQWWMQDWSTESKINHGCDIKSREALLQALSDIFNEHKNDELVLMMHHPMHSSGHHGGNFPLIEHIFPLRALNKNLWIPLPILGSLPPLYVKLQGTEQDIAHPTNRALMDAIQEMATINKNKIIFASGHEHSLQYFDMGNQIGVVSGAGAKSSFTRRGKAVYAESIRGFAKISFYEKNESWIEYYGIEEGSDKGTLRFRTQIRGPQEGTEESEILYPSVSQKDTVVAADLAKLASKTKQWWLGDQYRNIWSTPTNISMIDLSSAEGGLKPLKRGGGMSSNSLRLESKDGKQYVLRSVNKVFTRGLDEKFKNLKFIDILRDQNSAYHPYGSWIVSKLAEEAEVYHTDPEFVYLKRQSQLGGFNKYFPEGVYLYEERPNGDWSGTDLFGSSKNIVSYSVLLDNLREKKDHHVDQEWVLKSRLFDILIHDWDRHDDQWRWASFKQDGKTIYRPIPRDRDLAFYKFKGVIPKLISSLIISKYKSMDYDVTDLKSLTFNGKYFDRYFLNDLEWSEWKPIIQHLQSSISDQDIDNSSSKLPENIRALSDAELNDKLKARRDNLEAIAKRFYDLISTEVEITGTDRKDHFEISIDKNGSVTVSNFVTKKGDRIAKYERTFYPNETKTVRIYGLRGDDTFNVSGTGKSGIDLIIVGGEGKDMVSQPTNNQKIEVYDQKNGIKIDGAALKDKTSNDIGVNEYDRYGFLYNVPLFSPQFHYNRDGFWFGATYSYIKHGWRESPYKSMNTFKILTAPITQGTARFDYIGHFPNLFGKIDFMPTIEVDFPRNKNFFGLGNETINDKDDLDFYWTRLNNTIVKPFLLLTDNSNLQFKVAPTFSTWDLYSSEGRILNEISLPQLVDVFDRKYYYGFEARADISFVDNIMKPTSGSKFNLIFDYNKGIENPVSQFQIATTWQVYLPISRKPEMILANNLGYKKTFGEGIYYLQPELGNKIGLRGFRNSRFTGDASFYENVDIRIKILESTNAYLPFDLGILGGYDVARVWYDQENSDKWHNSQTIGIWADFLGLLIIQPYYSFTPEGNTVSVLSRFNF